MWLRNRRKNIEPDKALEDAQATLEEIQARNSEVHEVAGALKSFKEETIAKNNLAENLLIAMGRLQH